MIAVTVRSVQGRGFGCGCGPGLRSSEGLGSSAEAVGVRRRTCQSKMGVVRFSGDGPFHMDPREERLSLSAASQWLDPWC
jgi:hypothetical protein